MVSRAAAGSARVKSGQPARSAVYNDREKRALVDKLVALPAKGLVEAIHIIKRAQPPLDMGLEANVLRLNFDALEHATLVALDTFLQKVMY